MKITNISGRTYALEGECLMGLYRLDGNQCILIDSGFLHERQDLADTLARENLTPIGVLSTHIHIDHSINNGWLRETYGAAAAAPAGEVFMTASPLGIKGGYMYCFSPDTLAKEWEAMFHKVDCPIPAEDGTFTFCGVPFRIIHTPGHSLDHISVVTPDNVCCTGDAVLAGNLSSFKLPYALSIAAMIDSAQRLRSLNCAAYLVCHRGIYQEIEPLIDQTRSFLCGRADEIRDLVDHPMTWEELWKAVNFHFSLLSSRPSRAAKMEHNLRAFVDYLVDTGKLELSAKCGLLYLSATNI